MPDVISRDYRTFDLRIFRARDGHVYPVSVLDSPAGQCDAEFRPPFTQAELDQLVTRMVDGELSDEEVLQFGQRLFAALFGGTVGQLWERSLGLTAAQGQGLRLRLRLDPPELQQVPWEFLHDPQRRVYLSTDPTTPLVRFLSLPVPVETLRAQAPLRVLVVSATPRGCMPLGAERERRLIEASLAPLVEKGRVELEFLPHATISCLSQRVRDGFHVLHFLGHGELDEETGEGVLLLEDETGGPAPLNGAQFGDVLRGTQARLVVLNACETARSTRDSLLGVAPRLVASGLLAVMANQFTIDDEAAQAIAHEFYAAVSDNLPVDAALAEARKIVRTAHGDALYGWGPPVLFMRSPDGRVIELQRPLMGKIAALPPWARLSAAAVALLLVLALGTTVSLNVMRIVPTPTPDLLPLITTPRATDEYLILVADYDGQGDYEAGRRIFDCLSEGAGCLGKGSRLRVAWQPKVVVRSSQDAQTWGERHDATAVVWGWYDGAGFNSFYRLIDASSVPVFDLAEQPFEDEQSLRRYVREDMPSAAKYLALLGTGLTAAYRGDGEYALAILNLAEDAWPEVALEEQSELAAGGLGLGDLCWFRAWVHGDVLGDSEQAAAEYRRALEIEGPHVPLAHYNLGLTCWDLGDLEGVVHHLEAFVEQSPAELDYLMPLAYRDLGNVLNELGREEDAETAYDKGAQLDPNEPGIPLARGWYAYLRGELNEAEAHYRRAMEIDPNYPWPYFNLALVHLVRRDAEASRQAYVMALQLSPNWFADPALEYKVALGDLDALLAQHPELEKSARPLRRMLEDALASTQ
jgi:tetratricopeptide (TPR) repeat protein